MIDISRHKFGLVQILKDIYSDISIASLLGFKGGAAAHLFYDLPRFSVDLEFNLLDPEKKNILLETIPSILGRIGRIKQQREKRFTLFFLLSYGEKEQNVKVEISKHIFPDHYKVKSYLGIPMLVMTQEDLFAHKLVALSDRKSPANRDYFDLWFFMQNHWDINKEIVELRTGLSLKEYLKKCARIVEAINEKYILQGLGEVLDTKLKNWTRENLKKELLFLIRFYLENV
jgi:predicted nucleotidyltransferase component of viral defense system